MTKTYYRCDWSHQHADTPVVIFYEVDEAEDVPRIVEVFANGHGVAEELADYAGRENELAGINSFVEGSFLDHHTREWLASGPEPKPAYDGASETLALTTIDVADFEAAWNRHRKG